MNRLRISVIILSAFAILMILAISGCSSSLTTTVNTPGVITTFPPVTPSQTLSSPSIPVTSAPISTTPAEPGVNQPPSPPVKQVSIDLITLDMAFDKSVITVPAGAQVIINFVNKDGVGHNFAAYTNESATTTIFIGDIISFSTIIYTFTAPTLPGTYFFRCDPHAEYMKGQLIVQ